MSVFLQLPSEMRGQSREFFHGHDGPRGHIWSGWEVVRPPYSFLSEKQHSHSIRIFNVQINSTVVLLNYDILSTVGERDTAIVKQFTTTADASGHITIKFESVSVHAKISGIEVISHTAHPINMSPVLRINCGGGAVGEWAADRDYQGGNSSDCNHIINSTRVSDPAPNEVYQSERWGDFTYNLVGFIAGTEYTVRFHFAEIFFAGTFIFTFKYTLAGCGTLSVDGKSFPIAAGDATLTTSYHTSQFTATSEDEPWEFVTLVISSQDFRKFFEDVITRFSPVLHLPPSHPVMRALCGIMQMLWLQQEIDEIKLDEMIFHFITCLRNTPGGQRSISWQARFAEADTFLKAHMGEPITIDDLIKHMQLSRRTLYECFHQHTNTTPIAYLTKLRLLQSCELLRVTNWTISEIAERCGFTDIYYFSRIFRKHLAISPSAYRNQLSYESPV